VQQARLDIATAKLLRVFHLETQTPRLLPQLLLPRPQALPHPAPRQQPLPFSFGAAFSPGARRRAVRCTAGGQRGDV